MRAYTGINQLVRAASWAHWWWYSLRRFYELIVFMRMCLFLPEGASSCVTHRCPTQRCSAYPCLFIPLFFMTNCQGKTSAQIHFVMLKPRGTHVLLLAHWACYLTPHRWMSACAASSWMQDLNSANRPLDGNTQVLRFVGALGVKVKKMEEQWEALMFMTSLITSRCVRTVGKQIQIFANRLSLASNVLLLNKWASLPKLTFHFLS